ncbi:MAG: sigma 54-interacting transcriptional regulator [Pseudomonadota bacterium]
MVAGPDKGRETALRGSVVVGSSPDAHLVLMEPHVSRRHATFGLRGDRVIGHDEGSRNGTHLNGVRVTQAEMPLGAVVDWGRTAVAVQAHWQTREVPPSQNDHFGELFGRSLAMREVFAMLERVAPTDVPVLIEGETGTGKELAARSIHAASTRRDGPYVVFDCGSIPRELAESELFGHKRGAFTGAATDRLGAFHRANGGTILLDEIGELPIELQPKLLRVLETGEVRSVGDDFARKVDVRVLAATNRDLHAEIKRGTFRQDLVYRLDVVRIRLPPLRFRPEDVPPLVERLLVGQVDPSEEIRGANLDRLLGYAWPGNVRELRNALMRAVVLAGRPEGRKPRFSELVLNVDPSMAPALTIGICYPGVTSSLPFKEAKDQLISAFERAYLEALLPRHRGVVSRAAEAAGISRKHLHDLISRLGLDVDCEAEEQAVDDSSEVGRAAVMYGNS